MISVPGAMNFCPFCRVSVRVRSPYEKLKSFTIMPDSILLDLLAANAIHVSTDKPFTWASGWLSPIYCDNRRALSSHEARQKICDSFCQTIATYYPSATSIAAVATGAIAMGAIVAHTLKMPFAYVRPKPKDHGMGNQIEGFIGPAERVVVLEDLISTGGSSLGAVAALRSAGVDVLGMVAIFTYAFPQAARRFAEAEVELHTLESYPHLLQLLREQGRLTDEQLGVLSAWRESPETWGR